MNAKGPKDAPGEHVLFQVEDRLGALDVFRLTNRIVVMLWPHCGGQVRTWTVAREVA